MRLTPSRPCENWAKKTGICVMPGRLSTRPARRARASAARGASAPASPARNNLAAAVRGKTRKLARCALAVAMRALDGRIGLAHRSKRFKFFMAIFTVILVNRHGFPPKSVPPLCPPAQIFPARDPIAPRCAWPCSWCAAGICWAARPAGKPGWYTVPRRTAPST